MRLRLVALLSIFQRAAGNSLRGRVVTYALGSTIILLYVAALAVLEAERNLPHAAITTFGDALWWAAATITTVGYGDVTPISTTGRTRQQFAELADRIDYLTELLGSQLGQRR